MSLHAEIAERSHPDHDEVEVEIYKDGDCVAEIALATPEHGGDELCGWVIPRRDAAISWSELPDRHALAVRRNIEDVGRRFVGRRSAKASA